ncbi:hypothetical protein NC652_028385 [Populus alba x Populus x berolinensis]|nr:hypothetical protein NC652_028385 [Populus alba x Populus x berolinensis]
MTLCFCYISQPALPFHRKLNLMNDGFPFVDLISQAVPLTSKVLLYLSLTAQYIFLSRIIKLFIGVGSCIYQARGG